MPAAFRRTTPDSNSFTDIIEALAVKGGVDKRMLFDPPFPHITDGGLLRVFEDETAVRAISILEG